MAIRVEVNGVQSSGGNDRFDNQNINNPNNNGYQPSNVPNNNFPPNITPPPSSDSNNGGNIGDEGYRRINLREFQKVDGTFSSMPNTDRIAEDIRHEIQQRGVVMVPGTANFTTLMQQMSKQESNNISSVIGKDAAGKIDLIENLREQAHGQVADNIIAARNRDLVGQTNPEIIEQINSKYKKLEEREHDRIDRYFDPQIQRINEAKEGAVAKGEENLSEVIEKLTDELSHPNPNSYMNRLKDDYKSAVWRRDNASTEEEAKLASGDAKKAQERINRVLEGGENKGAGNWSDARMAAMYGMQYMSSGRQIYDLWYQNQTQNVSSLASASRGDIYGAVLEEYNQRAQMNTALGGAIGTGAGALLGGLFGGGILGAGIGGSIGGSIGNFISSIFNSESQDADKAIAQIGQVLQPIAERIQGYNSLAMMLKSAGPVGVVRDAMINSVGSQQLYSGVDLSAFSPNSKFSLYDLGYTSQQFAQVAAERIKQRGFVDRNSVNTALISDALERVFNMSSGSLGQLSGYDRYRNTNVNNVISDIVSTMSGLGTKGLSGDDYIRTQEFMNYVTTMMNYQKSYMLRPSSSYAIQQVATAQSLFGNSLDERQLGALNNVSQAVQNPGGGYLQTLTYDVIQSLFPSARGNIRRIEEMQYSDNPRIQQLIQQAMARRLRAVYGDPESTTSGYLAFQQYYKIQNPHILEPIAERMIHRGYNRVVRSSPSRYVAKLEEGGAEEGYTPSMVRNQNILSDKVFSKLVGYQYNSNVIQGKILSAIKSMLSEWTSSIVNMGKASK